MGSTELFGVRYISLTWDDIDRLVEDLSEKVSDECSPDTLVGILRGGVVVAQLLSDRLGLDEIYVLGYKSYSDVGVRSDPVLYHPLALNNLQTRRVLLADDVSDTGATMKAASQLLLRESPRELRTATLHVKPKTEFMPDFHSSKVDGWIIYPWDRHEILRMMFPRLEAKLGSKALSVLGDIVGLDEASVRRIVSR